MLYPIYAIVNGTAHHEPVVALHDTVSNYVNRDDDVTAVSRFAGIQITAQYSVESSEQCYSDDDERTLFLTNKKMDRRHVCVLQAFGGGG